MTSRFVAFSDIMTPGMVGSTVAENNLVNLNAALRDSSQPTLIGDAADYYIKKFGDFDKSINLVTNSNVICLPGCRILRSYNSMTEGVLNVSGGDGTAANPPVTGARWRGGTFVGYVDEDVDPRPGIYPKGVVLRIDGDDIVIEDVTVEGYNAIALQVGGHRVRVINPTIRKPQRFVPARGGYPQIDVNGAGIRVKHGTGFRCYGGTIDSGEDAAIQFSGDFRYTTETVPGVISDGLFKDVRCTALTGRLMLVGSTSPLIENVRFEGITGRTLGASGCIRVQNRGREVDELNCVPDALAAGMM